MGEIIEVDFRRRERAPATAEVIAVPQIWEKFLELLRQRGIVEDDIQEVIDSVNSYKHYKTAEPEIQFIVDVWFSHTSKIR